MLYNPNHAFADLSGLGDLMGDICVLSPTALAVLGTVKLNSLGVRCSKIGTAMLAVFGEKLRKMNP